MKTDRKPPLARSPMRLRGRRPLRPPNANTPLRTPALTKTPMREYENRPVEYNTVSCDLRALAKMVQDELGAINAKNTNAAAAASYGGGCIGSNNLFERGRLYDVYSERRNERLRKKLYEEAGDGDEDNEPKTAYNLGVKVEPTKKKKSESLKKSVVATYASSVDRSQHPRYALRSTTKKPPLPLPMSCVEEKPTARKAVTTRSRRK